MHTLALLTPSIARKRMALTHLFTSSAERAAGAVATAARGAMARRADGRAAGRGATAAGARAGVRAPATRLRCIAAFIVTRVAQKRYCFWDAGKGGGERRCCALVARCHAALVLNRKGCVAHFRLPGCQLRQIIGVPALHCV